MLLILEAWGVFRSCIIINGCLLICWGIHFALRFAVVMRDGSVGNDDLMGMITNECTNG